MPETDSAEDRGATSSRDDGASDRAAPSEPVVVDVLPPSEDEGRRLGPRRGSTRRRGGDDPPPFFDESPGTAKTSASTPNGTAKTSHDRSDDGRGAAKTEGASPSSGEGTAIDSLGLPSDPGAIVRYMTHRYKGVGEKTAETLVDRLGTDLFNTLHERPESIASIVPPGRAEQVLEAWRSDYERRTGGNRSDGDSGGGNARRGGGREQGRGRGGD